MRQEERIFQAQGLHTQEPKTARKPAQPLGTPAELEPRVLGGREAGAASSLALLRTLEPIFQHCASSRQL